MTTKIPIKLKSVEWKPILETGYSASSFGEIRHDESQKVLNQSLNSSGYLEISCSCLSTNLVHRLVAMAFYENPYDWPIVDHINRVRNDARAVNLQWASHSINMMNKAKTKNCKSIYTGVTTVGKKWQAYLTVNSKRVHLGMYLTELEAATAYNEYIQENELPNQLNEI